MSQIGDFCKKFRKIETPLQFKTSGERQAVPESKEQLATTEQFIESAIDLSPKANEVMGQVKEEVIKPLDDYLKEHPDLKMFLPLLVAGGVAGWLDKKTEEKKIATEYLNSLEKFAKKVKRELLMEKMLGPTLPFVAISGGVLFALGFCYAIANSSLSALGLSGLGIASSIGGLKGLNKVIYHKYFHERLSKDKKIAMDGRNLAALTLSGNKLGFYELKKGEQGYKLEEKKVVDLPDKATRLIMATGGFVVDSDKDTWKFPAYDFMGRKL